MTEHSFRNTGSAICTLPLKSNNWALFTCMPRMIHEVLPEEMLVLGVVDGRVVAEAASISLHCLPLII